MKSETFGFVTICLASFIFSSSAATLYVDLNCTNPVSPYADWSKAATSIQDAIDASTNGDLVLVTNGVYAVGGKSMDGMLTNRVSLDKAITVQSVNGPFVSLIQGGGTNIGSSAVRCAWLTNNAALIGFTLAWGATEIYQNNPGRGGGAWCASSNAILADCLIISNTAFQYGGGVYQGTMNNCLVSGNKAFHGGGGSYGANLNNCTVVSNGFGLGSGVTGGKLTNCIVYYNEGGNSSGSVLAYCCTMPLPPGPGNLTNPPQFFVDGMHLTSSSPCIGTGTTAAMGTDIFGRPWANPPSIGCTEWQPEPVTLPLQLQLTGAPVGFSISPLALNGQPPFSFQWLKNGEPVPDDGHFSGSQMMNLIATGIKFSDGGIYQFVASNAVGVVTSAPTQLVIHCVDVAGSDPQLPYTNWANAATNIQDAIDAAAAGEVVLVTNGLYSTGGRVMTSGSSNRVVLDRPLIVSSVNGYTVTTIRGAWDPVSTNGPAGIRCAWVTNGAVLNGFTLENGATGTGNSVGASYDSGGGVWCASTNAIVSNCELTNNCSVFGGGIYGGTLNNSLVVGNVAVWGGGAYNARLNNCTVVSNYCMTRGGGTCNGVVRNSIVLANYGYQFPIGMDDYYSDFSSSGPDYSYSFTYPMPTSGTGNVDPTSAAPFLDLFHIASTSACFAAGNELYASGTDLDGEPWANPPSIGCDEVVLSNLLGPLSVSLISSQSNVLVSSPTPSLPPHPGYFQGNISGRASYVAWSFGDGQPVTNYGAFSWHYWTNTGDYMVTFTAFNTDHPQGVSTNVLVNVIQLDVPRLQAPLLLTNGFQFQFDGQWNANYTIQYATNLVPPVNWQTLETFPWNYRDVIQFKDPAATNAARFYRVLAQ